MPNTSFTPQEIEQFLQQFFDVVGARQYIGARYVPIFGRAGSDTVEWDDLAPYEPLTVVMHDGVSYVSRRYVPAGIEITNTDYWVQTYRFNAQVEQYRQQVLAMQDDVDNRIPFPDPDFYPRYGELGQVLSTLADGTVKWQNPVVPSDEQAEEVITAWLDDHPEATTTVQDNSITDAKLVQSGGILSRTNAWNIASRGYTAWVGFYGQNYPTFTRNGQSVTVTIPSNNPRFLYRDGDVIRFSGDSGTGQTSIEVPHNHVLYFDNSTKEFVASSTYPIALTSNQYLCFYNSDGNINGPWSVYEIRQKAVENTSAIASQGTRVNTLETDDSVSQGYTAWVGFYGQNYPTFTRVGQSVTVTLPSNNPRFLYRDGDLIRFSGSTGSGQTSIEVPHNHVLYYDNNTLEFVASSTYPIALTSGQYLCFYNSDGNINGPWSVYEMRQKAVENATAITADETRISANEDEIADIKAVVPTTPSYYDSYMPDKIDAINALTSGDSSSIAFVFITDIHRGTNNPMNSVPLTRDILKRCGLDLVILGGDYLVTKPTKAEALTEISDVCNSYEYTNAITLRLAGNHEYNNPGADPTSTVELSESEIAYAILNPQLRYVTAPDLSECNFFYDDVARKVRYIALTSSVGAATPQSAVTFLAEQLNQVPTGYSVIVVCHSILDSTGIPSATFAQNMVGLMDAYNARGMYTAYGVTYDYSSEDGEVILGICGHEHADLTYTTTGGIPIIATTCDNRGVDPSRPRGTTNEQAFDVVVIGSTAINCIRIGYGNNRVISR